MKLYLSPKAQYQFQALKAKNIKYAEQVKAILLDIKEHPLCGIGTPEPVDPLFPDYLERRYNGSGMILYFYEDDYAVILNIGNELLPSHEELPSRLQIVSEDDYLSMLRQMEANRGHGNDPKVGIFWYNSAWNELFGVVSHPVRDYTKANASDGRITCSELHEDVWRKEYNRQKHHGDGNGPFIGPYENKPRGRVFYIMEEDRFVVTAGKWLEEFPQAKSLILEEFDLPESKTTFQYAVHWDIGHTWR
ncbi:MAG: type II toxin-antitoxin system YoeB family toxin [Bacteroidales bacterium]|nr:type II toxin-antitoxin system YoeB family toxin [Bacteroidales bacterium]